jgi:hypothetical protein
MIALPPGRPVTIATRPRAIVRDGRRHRRARALAGLHAIGDQRAADFRHEREVGQLVVEQESARRS